MKPSLHKTPTLVTATLTAALAFATLTGPSAFGADLYWDSNGTAPGAGNTPSGIWGIDNFWNTDAAGTGTPGSYADNSDVIFAAGSDAVNAYSVTLNGNQIANSITFRSVGLATLSGSELHLGSGGLTASQSATLSSITRMTADQTWNIGTGATLTQVGNLLGNYALTKTGAGTLVLSSVGASGTAFSSLRISEGVVNVIGTGILGNQTDLFLDDVAGATLDFTGSTGSKGFRSLNGGGSNGGNVVATTTISFYGAAGVSGDYSGVISGGGGFSILSAGKQTLRGENTYRGITTITRGGTLEFTSIADVNGGPSALGSVATVAAGTITMGLAADTVASTLRYIGTGHSSNRNISLANATGGAILDASGTGALKISGNVNSTGAGSKTLFLTGTNTGDNTLSGVINNQSSTNITSLTKRGSGRWVLEGDNTYTGATLVESGTLIVNGSLSSGSAVTVEAGATLGGHGVINGSATIHGTLAAGGGFTTLSTGQITFSGTSTLDLHYGRTGGTAVNDRVSVTGLVTIDEGANLNFTTEGSAAYGDLFFLILNDGTDAIQGEFSSFNNVVVSLEEGSLFEWNSQQWQITYQADFESLSFTGGNDLALMAVPEPGTWLLLAAGGAALAYQRRRFKSAK